MSQKKAKLINRFLKNEGMDKTGQQWETRRGIDKKGNVIVNTHTLRDDKRVKRAYASASAKDKKNLSAVMLLVNKKHDQTKKINL